MCTARPCTPHQSTAPRLLRCCVSRLPRQQHQPFAQVLRCLEHPGAWVRPSSSLLIQPGPPLLQLSRQRVGLRHQLPRVLAICSTERAAQPALQGSTERRQSSGQDMAEDGWSPYAALSVLLKRRCSTERQQGSDQKMANQAEELSVMAADGTSYRHLDVVSRQQSCCQAMLQQLRGRLTTSILPRRQHHCSSPLSTEPPKQLLPNRQAHKAQ